MKLRSLFMVGAILGFASFTQVAQSAPQVTYTGDTETVQGPGGSAIASGANAATPGVSAQMDMEYSIPDVIALGIFEGTDVTNANGLPLLASRWATGLNSHMEITNVTDILNDIIQGANTVDSIDNSEVLKIGGVAYSSTGTAVLTLSTTAGAGTDNKPANSIVVAFINSGSGGGAIDVAFNGSFTGNGAAVPFAGLSATSISTGGVTMATSDNRGTFLLYGDVIEGSVTSADDVGLYAGSLTITAVTN